MLHTPISVTALGLNFPQKVCFSGFSTKIHPGMRIAITGRNGSGKSTLLKILMGEQSPSEGAVHIPKGVSFGYVPQVIEEFSNLSGGQRLNAALTQALSCDPDILLLDEPTNHLDLANRRSLMRLLQKFSGTLIVVSHDVELLRTCVGTFWHIQDGTIAIFSGSYDAWRQELDDRRASIEHELGMLDRQKKQTHKDLMKEQTRAKKSKLKGEKKREQGHWPTLVASGKKRQAQETAGRHNHHISTKKQELVEKLEALRLPETITPKFSLQASEVNPSKVIVSVTDGCCGYGSTSLLEGIYLSLPACGRLAITGNNGSGKTTLVKAMLNDPIVAKSGDWIVPKQEDIGYLDQHYSTLLPQRSVLQNVELLVPAWPREEIRRHLNDFLFRKNEDVLRLVATLSGGEKARLSLAQIAAKTPRLLVLDEVTPNPDLEEKVESFGCPW